VTSGTRSPTSCSESSSRRSSGGRTPSALPRRFAATSPRWQRSCGSRSGSWRRVGWT